MMEDIAFDWTIITSERREFLTIARVERSVMGRRETGFFKFAEREQQAHIGPLLANELIANRLAKHVGLPVARTDLVTINGKTGLVSMVEPSRRVWIWDEIGQHVRRNFVNYIVKPQRLYKTFVFDIWICNIDRSGENIIVYRKGQKYDFYLIDHELSLLGALRFEEKPWNSAYWDSVVKYSDGYKPALPRHINRYEQLVPYIKQIQGIRPATIRGILNKTPSGLLSDDDRRIVERLLFYRQRRLQDIVLRWIREYRMKNSRRT